MRECWATQQFLCFLLPYIPLFYLLVLPISCFTSGHEPGKTRDGHLCFSIMGVSTSFHDLGKWIRTKNRENGLFYHIFYCLQILELMPIFFKISPTYLVKWLSQKFSYPFEIFKVGSTVFQYELTSSIFLQFSTLKGINGCTVTSIIEYLWYDLYLLSGIPYFT